jgi:hypothetical protein
MLGRSAECEAVLARYGLAECPMTIIGADKRADPPAWGVTIICEAGRSEFLDVVQADRLSQELRRIREDGLAKRLGSAVEAAKQRMRPRD